MANIAARRLKENAEVTVVDKSGKHVYQPGFVYVAFAEERVNNIVKDERSLLNKNVKLITKEAVKIDPRDRKVLLADGETPRVRLLSDSDWFTNRS